MISVAWDSQKEEEDDNEVPSSQQEDNKVNEEQIGQAKLKIISGYIPQIPISNTKTKKDELITKFSDDLDETQESQALAPLQVNYLQDPNLNLDCLSQQPSQTLSYLTEPAPLNIIEKFLEQVIENDEKPSTPEKWAYELSQTNYSQELTQ